MKKKPKVVVGFLSFEQAGMDFAPAVVWGFGYSYFQATCSVPYKYRHLSYLIYEAWCDGGFHPDFEVITSTLDGIRLGMSLVPDAPYETLLSVLYNQREELEDVFSLQRNRVTACLRLARNLSGRWYDAERQRLRQLHREEELSGCDHPLQQYVPR